MEVKIDRDAGGRSDCWSRKVAAMRKKKREEMGEIMYSDRGNSDCDREAKKRRAR